MCTGPGKTEGKARCRMAFGSLWVGCSGEVGAWLGQVTRGAICHTGELVTFLREVETYQKVLNGHCTCYVIMQQHPHGMGSINFLCRQ